MTGPAASGAPEARAQLYARLMLERFGDPSGERYVSCPETVAYTGDGPTAEWLSALAAGERLMILAKEIDEEDASGVHAA